MINSHTYALLVGINKYPSHLPQLEGCVNDLHAFKRFLFKRIPPDQLHIEVLKDQAATKANLVEKFESHLAKATKNDTVLFYFSGHGSREPNEELARGRDPDIYQDTLVCYDSRLPNGMDLANKELYSLLGSIVPQGTHICTILDCCHTGSAARSLANDPPALFWTRGIESAEQLRSLDSYILPPHVAIDRSTQIASTASLFPQTRHVSLHSSQEPGHAKEVIINGRKRGVFTYCLLEVLKYSKGHVTYADVMRRLDCLQAQRTADQIPQLLAPHPDDIHLPFLRRKLPESGEFFQLSFSGTKGWIIDGGLNQGLKEPSTESSSTLFGIYEENASEGNSSQRLGQVALSQVFPEESSIVMNGVLELNATHTYQARIEKIPADRFGLCIRGDSAEGKLRAQQAFSQENASFLLQEVGIREIAHFNLIAKLDIQKYSRKPGFAALSGYVITRSSDRDDQVIAEYIEGFGLPEAEKAISYLNKIAWWKKVVELHNPGSRLPSEVVQLELVDPVKNAPLLKQAPYTFSYFDSDPNSVPPKFRLRLSHDYSQKLYCVLIYLSSEYGIQTQLMGEKGRWLEPGEMAWALEGKVLTAKVSERQLAWENWKIQERFKVIVATHEFDISQFNQQGTNGTGPSDSAGENRFRHSTEFLPTQKEKEAQFDWTSNELVLTVTKRD